MKLAEIASKLGARLENSPPDTEITGVAGIETAGPGELTFISNPKYGSLAKTTRASAVIVSEDFPAIPSAMLRSKNPYLDFARALELFSQPPQYRPGIHPTALVHVSAKIGKGAHLGPYVVVEGNVEMDAGACHKVVTHGQLAVGAGGRAHPPRRGRDGDRFEEFLGTQPVGLAGQEADH